MAQESDVLERCGKEFDQLLDELRQIANQLESEAQGEGIVAAPRALLAKSNEISQSLKTEHKTLEQCIDIYYAAESRVAEQAKPLMAASIPNAAKPAAKSAAVMEGWLSALVHKQNQEIYA